MEFWGVEVPSGKPLTCQPGPASYVHVSQAALGDNKNAKGNDRVVLKVKVGSNEVVVGTLSQGKCDQTTLDLIFEKDFVLSHSSSGSVYFCGYKTDAVREDDSMSSGSEDDEFEMSDEEDEIEAALPAKENGRVASKPDKVVVPVVKPASKSPAPKGEVSIVEVKPKLKPAKAKGVKEKSGDDDEEDDEEEDSDEDDEMMESGSDDEDLDSDEEDESDVEESDEEEVKLMKSKKRPAPTPKAVNAVKKGKTDTPGKAEPKTPSTVPASTPKQQQSGKKDQSAKKTPGKENANTPASGKKLGQFFCQPCTKNFNSESALSQHKTAKHKS